MKCLLLRHGDIEILSTIKSLLEQGGWELHSVSTTGEAFTFCEKHQPQIFMLTYVDEAVLALADRIRERAPGCTVTLALLEEQPGISLDRMLDCAVDDIMFPPFTSLRVECTIKLAIKRATMLAELKRTEEQLRRSELVNRAVLDTTVDGIITIDVRGSIQLFNKAAERIFGYHADEIIGKNVSLLMPSPFQEEHDGYLQSYHDTNHKRIIGIGREVKGFRKNGEVFPMDLAVSEMKPGTERQYAGIVRDITERRQLEHQLLTASEEERRRIGSDLHDGLGQMLTGIGLIAQNLIHTLEKKESPGLQEARELLGLLKEADEQARVLTRTLIPVDLEEGGLKSALIRLTSNVEVMYSIKSTIEFIGALPKLDASRKTHFYRIIQEALTNAARHSEASRIRVTVLGSDDKVRARIQDNGTGIDPAILKHNEGMGLRIMKHRADVIGALLDIRNGPNQGTILTCTLPVMWNGKTLNTAESEHTS